MKRLSLSLLLIIVTGCTATPQVRDNVVMEPTYQEESRIIYRDLI